MQNEDLDEWNDVGLQRSDLEAKSKNVEQPQSNTRACSKPYDLKATGKSAFCGFQVPPKPEDEAIAKVCLEVEEKLHAAVRQNDPLDARKSLLRKVLLRLQLPEEHLFLVVDSPICHSCLFYIFFHQKSVQVCIARIE